MPLGQGESSSGNVDGATTITRRLRFSRRSVERINPGNIEFGRQVAAIMARQEEQALWSVIMGRNDHLNSSTHNEYAEDDQVVPFDNYPRLPPPPALLIHASRRRPRPSESKQQQQQKQQESMLSFLEGTFLKTGSSGKQKATRNMSSKNNKKKKGKSRKQPHASEMQSELCTTEPSSTCVNAASGERLPFSSSFDTTDVVPLLEYSSSSSSQVTAELICPVSSASSGNEKELSSSSNEFRSFSTSYYTASSSSVNDLSNEESVAESYTGCNAWNNNKGDAAAASSLSEARSKLSWSAAVLADSSLGLNEWGGDRSNKPMDYKSFSVTVSPTTSSSQEAEARFVAVIDTSHDGEFQKVISRKTAQKLKKMQRLRSPTPSPTVSASVSVSALVPKAPSDITIGQYIRNDCFSRRKPNHKKGKYKKGQSLGTVLKTAGFANEGNVPGNSSRTLLITVHPGNLESNQMALSSTSHHHAALEVMEETCSSGCLPLQGELKALAPADGDANKDTDSRAAFSDKTSSLDRRGNFSCGDWEEEKNEENKEALSIISHESVLDQIIKVVNDAYQIQGASNDVYMSCGHPVADIETFLRSATPIIIEQIPPTSNSCMQQSQPVCIQPYRDQMPGVALGSVWNWYEEPESFGIEVEIHRNIKCGTTGHSGSEICAYFAPSLSAVQLFGQSSFNTSSNNGVLLFEYFEWENPFSRPPLFTKIKQLVSGVNLHGNNTIFGDPKQLESVKLSDLHPASWFCVAWYPIYQIPSTPGRYQAAFLTYHSLGKLVPQTCFTDMADGLAPIVCPIVGLLSYKDEGEKWFQLGEQPPSLRSKPTSSGGSSEKDPAELLIKRIRALKHGASVMSKALVPKATGEAMNHHQDYEFFCSRAL